MAAGTAALVLAGGGVAPAGSPAPPTITACSKADSKLPG
jgi:hypothetical protein